MSAATRTAGTPIGVLDGFLLDARQRARLEAASPRLRITHRHLPDQAAVDAIEDDRVEVLLADHAPSDVARTPGLRWLQYSGAGVDPLAPAAPWERGLVVTTASGIHATDIAEYTLGAMLIASHRWRERVAAQRRRRWAWDARRAALVGLALAGRTVAIVGYGSVGREVARLASALGMRILAVKARPGVRQDEGWTLPGRGDPDGHIPERMVGLEGLRDVISDSDFVVVAAPLTGASRGALGDGILAAIRPDAWLVNVGRGALFDEPALVAALRAGRLAGATLDVTETEPLPADSPLWRLPNVVLTPHVSGAGVGVWDRLTDLFAENLRRYAAGEPLLNAVRPEGY